MKKLRLFSIFLFLAVNVQAADYYWRSTAVNNNFNNPANWTDSSTGVGGSSPGSAPTVLDNVYFVGNSNIKTIALSSGTGNMADLTVTFPDYSFGNGTWNIAGNISLDGTFKSAGTVNIVNNTNAANTTIDVGTDEQVQLGVVLSINKPGSSVSVINHDLNSKSRIDLMNSSFYSNGFNVTATRILTGNATAPRVIDFTGSVLTTTATSGSNTENCFYSENTTYVFDDCDFICNNTLTNFRSAQKAAGTYNFNSITFQNSVEATLQAEHYVSHLVVENLIINTPSFIINSAPSYGGKWPSITVNEQLTLAQKCNVMVTSRVLSDATVLNVKNLQIAAVGCDKKSSLRANYPVTLTATASAITTSGLAYSGINFAGAGWTASAADNMGNNAGNVTWTSSTGKKFYWIGGDGNWDDPTHWSYTSGGGANADVCIPSVIDDVYVDANSFTAGDQKITMSYTQGCKNIYWTDATRRGSLHTANANVSLIINGDVDFSGVSLAGVYPDLYFKGDGTHSITSAADTTYSSKNIYFQGTGSYSLVNNFISRSNINATRWGFCGSFIFHYSGALSSNGKKIDVGRFVSVSFPTTATRSIDFKNSEIYLYYNSNNTTPAQYMLDLDKTNLLAYDFSGSHFFLNTVDYPSYNEGYLRAVGGQWIFNDVTYLNSDGSSVFSFDSDLNEFNNLTINSSFSSGRGFIVDTLTLTPNKTYRFGGGKTIEIKGALIPRTNDCNMVTLASASTAKTIFKTGFTPFEIQGAKVSGINASPNPLTVTNGIDEGNNQNVTINASTSRNFYWVGGEGNWSDCTKWSIGVSGGDPTVTNSSCCLPADNDSVFFDANSFTAANQVVTLDLFPFYIHSMIWTPEAGEMRPVLRKTIPNVGFSLKGSLQWAENMTLDLAAGTSVTFTGKGKTENAQYLKTNGVTALNMAYVFSGGGRYDLLDRIVNAYSLTLNNNSDFYTHGNDINISYLYFTQGALATVNLEDSYIYAYGFTMTINNCATFHSANADIHGRTLSIVNDNCEPTFRSIKAGYTLSSRANTVRAQLITMLEGGSNLVAVTNINGKFETDTLLYDLAASTHQIQAGSTIVVNDTIIGKGTPCAFINLRSSDVSAGGVKAIVKTNNCDMDLTFFTLQNVTGQNENCSSQAFSVLGNDLGGNENVSFRLPPSASNVFADTIVACQHLPYVFNPQAAGSPVSYKWFRNNVVDAGQTGAAYPVSSIGTYKVEVTYPGVGCVSAYQQHVTSIIDTIAPKIASLTDTLIIIQTGSSHVFTGNTHDPQITENCFLKDVWYSLSGATVADSVPASTINNVRFNTGATTVTWHASDSIPSAWLSAGERNVGNSSFVVTVERFVAKDDYANVMKNASVTVPVLVNDSLPSTCTPVITLPENPTEAEVSGNEVIYTPVTGFTGSDTIVYRVSCSGVTSDARIIINVLEYPDNISDAECIVEPETQDWAIQKLDSVGLVYTCGQFLVGDMNDDGFPDIVAIKNYPIDGLVIFYGPDFKTSDSINVLAPEPQTFGAIAKVKVDGGYENLIFFRNSNTNRLHAVRRDGTSPWTSFPACEKGIVGLADFNHDGWAEVYVGNKIFDAATGKLLASGSGNSGRAALMGSYSSYIAHPYAVDILGDANLELVAGNEIYEVEIDRAAATAKTLKLISSVTPPSNCPSDGVTVVADFDNDGQLEVLVRQRGGTSINTGNTTIHLYLWSPHTGNSTGKMLASTTDIHTFFGIPFVGDIDGADDGRIEIVTLGSNSKVEKQKGFIARKYDEVNNKFVTFWNIEHIDQSGGTGMTLFDFNLDDIAEIVYRDEYELRIINGSGVHHETGLATAPYTLSSFKSYSATSFEYPVVADIYGNGSSAILVTSDTGETRTNAAQNNYTNVAYIDIFTSDPSTPWAPARKVWNQYSYNAVVVNEDLTIPTYKFDMATVFPGRDSIMGTADDVRPYNNFLQQQTMLSSYGIPLLLTPNAEIASPEPTYTYGSDSLLITVSISNNGNSALRNPVHITVYKDSVHVNSVKYTYAYADDILAGETVTITFSIPDFSSWVGQIYDSSKLILKINDKGNAESDQPVCAEDNVTHEKAFSLLLLADDDYAMTEVNTSVVIDILANDVMRSCEIGDSIPVITIGEAAKHGEVDILAAPVQIEYSPDSGWVGIDSLRYITTTCGTMKDSAMVYIATLKSVSRQYVACPTATISLGMQPITGITYYWYTEVSGGASIATGNNLSVVKNDSLVQTWYVEARYNGFVFPRYRVDLLMGENCGVTDPEGCAVDGTVIWTENFDRYDNGLSPSSSVYSQVPLPTGMTTYTFTNVPGTIHPNTGIYAEASYALIKDGRNSQYPTSYTSHFTDDHTWPDNNQMGRFLITNGRTVPDRVYVQKIDSLCTGMNELYFSFWMAGHDGELEWSIYAEPSNELLTVYKLPKLPARNNNVWKYYGFPFLLPDGINSVRFEIYNTTTSMDGNDVVYDDIEVRLCTPLVEIVNPIANDTVVCGGGAFVFEGNYEDDGTFGDDLEYRWMYSTTGDINTVSDWALLAGTGASGSVSDGKIETTYTIDSTTVQHSGYYRLLVGNASTIDETKCRGMSRVVRLRVYDPPKALIIGNDSICRGETATLSPTRGGTWVSSNPSAATVSSDGRVTAIGDGIVTFTFTDSISGCTDTTLPLTIGTYPDALDNIQGPDVICINDVRNISVSTVGGTWSTSNPTVVSINNVTANPALIIGLAEGTSTISYTAGTNGCVSTVIHQINVLPSAPPGIIIGIEK